MGEYAHLRVESVGDVLTVTLDRPERLNALNEARADALVALLADGPAIALGLTERLLAGAFEGGAVDAIDREFTAEALCIASEDAEGAAAFLSKRAPRRAGR